MIHTIVTVKAHLSFRPVRASTCLKYAARWIKNQACLHPAFNKTSEVFFERLHGSSSSLFAEWDSFGRTGGCGISLKKALHRAHPP